MILNANPLLLSLIRNRCLIKVILDHLKSDALLLDYHFTEIDMEHSLAIAVRWGGEEIVGVPPSGGKRLQNSWLFVQS